MLKVLIVEDQVNMVLTYRMALADSGYQLGVARNGLEAARVLQGGGFDVVVTDWMMPDHDGLELIKWIRGNVHAAPPIVMVTSLGLSDAAQKALNAGADEYIIKPIVPEQLLSVLDRVVKRQKKEIDRTIFMQAGKSIPLKQNMYAVAVVAGSGAAPVLQHVLSGVGPSVNAAFLVVAHGPEWALEALADKLSPELKIPLSVASDGQKIQKGRIFLAPGNRHMVLGDDGLRIRLDDSEPENFVKPSADPLMRSVARAFGAHSVGVILGGIGRDGLIGAGFIHVAGGTVIVLDPAEAVVPQMSESAVEMGMADEVLKSTGIVERIRKL